MPPKMTHPVLVGVSDIFVHIAAKLLHCIGEQLLATGGLR